MADPALPPDWVERVDKTSGRKYYKNTATNERTWRRPATGGGADAPLNDSAVSAASGASGASGSSRRAPPPDADDWVESFDERRQRAFYFS